MSKKTKQSENKIRRVNLRLTEEEYTLILQNSEKFAQKNISNYVRKHLLGQKMNVRTYDETGEKFNIALRSYTDQIKKIGRNYNQVVRYLQAKHPPQETKILLEKLEKLTEMLLKNSAQMDEISKKILHYYDSKNQQK